MLHRLPVPSGKSFRLSLGLLLLFSLTHCQKKDETPPPPKVQPPATESSAAHETSMCCRLAPATDLKEGMGRVIIAFPEGHVPSATRVAVLKDGKEMQAGHGSQRWEIPSGTYAVSISNKSLSAVTVQAGQETNVKVGVLHVNALPQTRIELLDQAGGKVFTSGHGEQLYGLPIGPVTVQVAGQSDTVTIEEGKVTEF